MTEYTASNGTRIRIDDRDLDIKREGGWVALCGTFVLDALREFFQHERDEELGRWRWPENPNYVVYPDDDGGGCVIDERDGGGGYRNGLHVHDMEGEAVRAYRAAHQPRKPYLDARPGDVWVISTEGEEHFAVHAIAGLFGSVQFVTVSGKPVNMSNSTFTGFRKIWPEGDAS